MGLTPQERIKTFNSFFNPHPNDLHRDAGIAAADDEEKQRKEEERPKQRDPGRATQAST